ncbi:MAG TPA: sulfur carrier protein ThiS [Gammaproteobacteria bacterium]|nr:sulfur carrier protein ThiS [Gammaproteobacteria bacterium]
MEIFLNGDSTELPDDLTATQLIERLELAGRRIAMEVNGGILPRSSYAQHKFQAGDRVEIVHAIGGG